MFRLMSECVDDLCHAEADTLEELINMPIDHGEGTPFMSVAQYMKEYGGYIEYVAPYPEKLS